MRRAGPSEDDDESKNRDDQTRADYEDALQHLTRRSSATAGGGERCFRFILHKFILQPFSTAASGWLERFVRSIG
jgi:hypothetical protein